MLQYSICLIAMLLYCRSFVNHAIYWSVMSPNPNGTERFPVGRLLDEIEKTFGSYYTFKVQFSTTAMDVFGSGRCSFFFVKHGNVFAKVAAF